MDQYLPVKSFLERPMSGTEITFEVAKNKLDEGYSATALDFGIHMQRDSIDELRQNIRKLVDCSFDSMMERPNLIHLHFVRNELLVSW